MDNDKAIELLRKAREVLGHYWFGYDDDGEGWNNEDVIEISEEIDEFLKD